MPSQTWATVQVVWNFEFEISPSHNNLLCTHAVGESALILTSRSREIVRQRHNELFIGWVWFQGYTGSNTMCWQVGGRTLEGHHQWVKGWGTKGCCDTPSMRLLSAEIVEEASARLPTRPLRENRSLLVLQHRIHFACEVNSLIQGSQCGDDDSPLHILLQRRWNTYWRWGWSPWGTGPLRKPGHRSSEIHSLKWKNKWMENTGNSNIFWGLSWGI